MSCKKNYRNSCTIRYNFTSILQTERKVSSSVFQKHCFWLLFTFHWRNPYKVCTQNNYIVVKNWIFVWYANATRILHDIWVFTIKFICLNSIYIQIKIFILTRRLGNVRWHIRFRPRPSTILAKFSTKWGTDRKTQKLFFANLKRAQVFFKKFCMNEKIASKANNSVE